MVGELLYRQGIGDRYDLDLLFLGLCHRSRLLEAVRIEFLILLIILPAFKIILLASYIVCFSSVSALFRSRCCFKAFIPSTSWGFIFI